MIRWVLYRSVERFSWVKDAIGIKSQDEAGTAIAKKIREWDFAGKRVGVETTAPKFLPDILYDPALKLRVINAGRAFPDMKVIKSGEEINLLEKATLITEEVIDKTIKTLHEGMTDFEIIRTAKRLSWNAAPAVGITLP
jgi:Xaa-Pro aminopeptidase